MADEYIGKNSAFTATADAIREKSGSIDPVTWDEETGFEQAVLAITGGGGSIMPQFTYTVADGYTTERDDKTGDWKIRFLKSGKLTFTSDPPLIDIFVVGGGGGSAGDDGVSNTSGGGGYTKTKIGYQPEINKQYTITIGSGGSAGGVGSDGGRGGTSSAFGFSADGGYGGEHISGYAGNGGSGGNGYLSDCQAATDGADGYTGSDPVYVYYGGEGQGTTTREFGESDGILYASGGATDSGGSAGQANTGNGGGGRPQTGSNKTGLKGGSGIVVIRGSL